VLLPHYRLSVYWPLFTATIKGKFPSLILIVPVKTLMRLLLNYELYKNVKANFPPTTNNGFFKRKGMILVGA
jgi:hypothetical protein